MLSVVELINRGFAAIGWPEVAWLTLLYSALDEPFTAGLMVTGMLLTTLFPTLLHLGAGLYGVFAVWSLGNGRAAAQIPEMLEAEMLPSEKQAVAYHLLFQRLWLLPAVLCPLILLLTLVTAASYWLIPIGLFLADIALCATSWSHGLCPWTG